jgi:hypothetical protein
VVRRESFGSFNGTDGAARNRREETHCCSRMRCQRAWTTASSGSWRSRGSRERRRARLGWWLPATCVRERGVSYGGGKGAAALGGSVQPVEELGHKGGVGPDKATTALYRWNGDRCHCPAQPTRGRGRPSQQLTSVPHVKGFLDFKINSKIDSQCGKIATKGINI